MPESKRSASEKAGLPAGELVHVGEVHHATSTITLFDYDKDNLRIHHIDDVHALREYKDTESVTWVVIEGLTDTGLIEQLGQDFDIHPLVLEDILSTQQRPKLDEYDDYLYLVLKRFEIAGDDFHVTEEQISILLFGNILFTIKEKQDDLFKPLITRLQSEKGRIRGQSADYLAYCVLDTIVDGYFALQDALDLFADDIEEKLLGEPGPQLLTRIQLAKRELIFVRKSLTPLREMLSALERSDSELITEKTHIYLRDVYDHAIRVIESMDSYRDLITGMLDIYLSSVSNRMNEVMKVLTMFATIFIPLSFLTGVYGMNFQFMPELNWVWSYPILWGVFLSIMISLLIFFRRKKWI